MIYQSRFLELLAKNIFAEGDCVPVNCSFCGGDCISDDKASSSHHGEKYEWFVCKSIECFYAQQICDEWLKSGGINDSQALRDDALVTAKRRREAALRRY